MTTFVGIQKAILSRALTIQPTAGETPTENRRAAISTAGHPGVSPADPRAAPTDPIPRAGTPTSPRSTQPLPIPPRTSGGTTPWSAPLASLDSDSLRPVPRFRARGKQPLAPLPSPSPLAPLEERPIAPLGWSDGLIERNDVLQMPLEVQGQVHPSANVKLSEEKPKRQKVFPCSVRFQSILEKVYSFQHLTERLLEAQGGLEAIRGEGRALFDRFQAHERSLVSDLVDLFLSYTGTTPIPPDAWLGGSRWQAMQTLRMKRALRDGPDTPNWVDERAVEALARPCSASPRARLEDQESNAVSKT